MRELAQQMYDRRITPQAIAPQDRGIPLGTADPGFDCMDLANITWLSTGHVNLVGYGRGILTPRAKATIRKVAGIDSDVFFRHMPIEDAQACWRRHFDTLPATVCNTVKVVARRPLPRENTDGADCIIRGFVGVNYFDIPNVVVLDKLRDVAGSKLDDMRVLASLDNVTTNISIIDPVAESMVKAVGDMAQCGLKIRNSSVGAAALSFMTYMWKKICGNGMGVTIDGTPLFSRKHSPFDLGDLRAMIQEAWRAMPNVIDAFRTRADALHQTTFESDRAHAVIDSYFQGYGKKFRQRIKTAYGIDPVPSAYGILQAVTRLASSMRISPEKRAEIEAIADHFVRRLSR